MSVGFILGSIAIAVAGSVLSTIISDKIKGYANLTTLKRLFSVLIIKNSSKKNNIEEIDNNVYEVQSPANNNDSVIYKFTSGSTISFSLKSIRKRYSDKGDFVIEMKKANQHLIDEGDVNDTDLLLILESVWKKANKNR